MEEFKSHIGIQLRSGQFDEQRLQLLSTVSISFCHDEPEDLVTPCWLCIINLMALDAIGDQEGMFSMKIAFQSFNCSNKLNAWAFTKIAIPGILRSLVVCMWPSEASHNYVFPCVVIVGVN